MNENSCMENDISLEQICKIKSKVKKLFIDELDTLEINRMTLSYNILEVKLNTIVEIIVLKMKLNNHIQLDNDIRSLIDNFKDNTINNS